MSAPPLRLLLIRHGEVLANREMRYVGARDEPLADSGIAQADRLTAASRRADGYLIAATTGT
ncbi:MAG TPA: histidine phosphatase family protein [Thermoanaerobaculia bacterium]